MLRTTKNMKEKYEKIQNYLFMLIPEKWEEIYLYASVVTGMKNTQSGELFFYYLPKGLLKKKPINVYEVPQRFNINEEQYLKIVEDLYKCIKDLKQDFVDTEQELWTNLTISIANFKFKVEYNYDILPLNEDEVNARHIIWRYKYLKIGGENKNERKILDEYFANSKPTKKESYERGLYLKTENNKVTFDRENSKNPKEFVMYEKESLSKEHDVENKDNEVFEKSVFKVEIENKKDDEGHEFKNQILNM